MARTFCKLMMLILLVIFMSSCAKNKQAPENEESGMFSQTLKIRSLPTKATIFINEKEIGTTPLKYKISHEDRRMLNVKAVPIYPNQYTQNIFLMVPPIPKKMTIYMNHYPEDYDRNKDLPFNPPEKPKPEVVVQTETIIDTVYVDDSKLQILSLPAIFFDTDMHNLNASEVPKLDEIVNILNADPALMLDIYGFADHRASEKHNMKLTQNRANSVKQYLVQKGINASRLAAFGHGKVSKVSTEGLEMDLQESRKVLFLLKK